MKTYQITLAETELNQIIGVMADYAETLNLRDDVDRTTYKLLERTYGFILGQAKHQGYKDLETIVNQMISKFK